VVVAVVQVVLLVQEAVELVELQVIMVRPEQPTLVEVEVEEPHILMQAAQAVQV
jgi:hypothetical protein